MAGERAAPGRERHILVVDDDRGVRAAMVRTLKGLFQGLIVVDFGDGRAALERSAEESFDLAILDIEMPGMDGVEVGRGLRCITVAIPLLFVTGNPESASERGAHALSPVAVIGKPWIATELKQIVGSILGLRDPEV